MPDDGWSTPDPTTPTASPPSGRRRTRTRGRTRRVRRRARRVTPPDMPPRSASPRALAIIVGTQLSSIRWCWAVITASSSTSAPPPALRRFPGCARRTVRSFCRCCGRARAVPAARRRPRPMVPHRAAARELGHRVRPWTEGNAVRALAHGRSYFPVLASALAGAAAGDGVWLAGWLAGGRRRAARSSRADRGGRAPRWSPRPEANEFKS